MNTLCLGNMAQFAFIIFALSFPTKISIPYHFCNPTAFQVYLHRDGNHVQVGRPGSLPNLD